MLSMQLTTIESDPKCILQDRAKPLCLTTLHQAKVRGEAIQKSLESLKAALDADTESHPFKLTTGQDAAALVKQSISKPLVIL